MADTASQILARRGVTVEAARDYILSHLHDLPSILAAADDFGFTNAMLAEIVGGGYTALDVVQYFGAHGLDSRVLEDPLLAWFLPPLAGLFALNDEVGPLATAALRQHLIAQTGEQAYWSSFEPSNFAGAADGVFSTADLGFSHLGSLPATRETLESLYYGTTIAAWRAVDASEQHEIDAFVAAKGLALSYGTPSTVAAYVDLLATVFLDAAAPPMYDDAQIQARVLEDAAVLWLSPSTLLFMDLLHMPPVVVA